jgi:hypothetical protein
VRWIASFTGLLPFLRFSIARGACRPVFNSRDRLLLEGSIFLREGARACVLAGATAPAFFVKIFSPHYFPASKSPASDSSALPISSPARNLHARDTKHATLCPPDFGSASSGSSVLLDLYHRSSILSYPFWCGLLQGEAGVVLELPDQKARVFLVLIALTRRFPEHARKLFDEMPVRTQTDFFSDFCRRSLARDLTCID